MEARAAFEARTRGSVGELPPALDPAESALKASVVSALRSMPAAPCRHMLTASKDRRTEPLRQRQRSFPAATRADRAIRGSASNDPTE